MATQMGQTDQDTSQHEGQASRTHSASLREERMAGGSGVGPQKPGQAFLWKERRKRME